MRRSMVDDEEEMRVIESRINAATVCAVVLALLAVTMWMMRGVGE